MTPMHPSLIAELVDLLASGNIEADEKDAVVLQVEAAPQEFDWASSDAQACSIALTAEKHRHCASGDKLDEIHEEVREILGDGFPEFPRGVRTHTDDFTWMEQQLSEWSTDEAYDLVEVDDLATDNMHVFVVFRSDVHRILEIAASLGLKAQRPLDHWNNAGAV